MAVNWRYAWSDVKSSEPYGDSLSPEVEKSTEDAASADDNQRLNSSPDRSFSSASLSHWSQSWSKSTDICGNSEQPQFSPVPDDAPSDEPGEKSAEILTDVSSTSSLYKDSNRSLTGAGLENLGNTCFLNSVLQCFIHTVPLLQPILSNGNLERPSNNCNKEGFCLQSGLRDLILGSLASNTAISPWDLVNNLTYISSNFQRFQQEDAHEFLQCFLDKLEYCHDSESKNCMTLQSDNTVQQVFGGRLVSNLKCCNCGHCSDTYEPSIDLSLEIDDVDNLFSALHSFTKIEKIEDPDNKFTCEKCKERVYVEKKLSFDQVPSVAVFHLKRFKNDGSFVQKIDKHVAFPLDLDLEPFTGSGKYHYAELQYVLYAVVVHTGVRPTSGHYYCFVRLSSDMWCKFDDSMVELAHEDYVLSQEAYVLFYAKEKTPWFSSFIESQKEFVNSAIWNTSPKSVLDNIDTLVSGCNSNEVKYDTGSAHEGWNNNEIKDSGAVQNSIKRKASAGDLQEMPSFSRDSPKRSSPIDHKTSPSLLVKVGQKEEVKNREIDIEAAFRSPSPEIYRENSPEGGFRIRRSHLRSGGSVPCKRRLEKHMDGEMKQARSFIQKNVHSSRGQQLMAALRDSQSEPSVNRKRSRRFVV